MSFTYCPKITEEWAKQLAHSMLGDGINLNNTKVILCPSHRIGMTKQHPIQDIFIELNPWVDSINNEIHLIGYNKCLDVLLVYQRG